MKYGRYKKLQINIRWSPFLKNTSLVLVPRWCWALHLSIISDEWHCVIATSTLQRACAICFYLISTPPSTDHSTFSVFPLPIDSQRSHLSSFTMKLMDKFHSPKIKRTPSKKGKQLQPEPAAKSTEKPANKVCVCAVMCQKICMCVLWEIHIFPTYSVYLLAYFVRRLFSYLMFCAPILHCVCVCASFPAGSHSFPVAVAAGFTTAGV